MTEINIGMLGHGFMGKAHSNAYRQVRHFFPGKLVPRMKAIFGPDRGPAEDAAAQFGWEEVETDWRKLVNRKDIDVIDVVTPNNLHAEQVIAAAEAGKHIICEKPLVSSLDQAAEVLACVDKAGVKNMVNFNYRRVPAVAYAKRLIESGCLGQIHHYRAAYMQDWIVDPNFPFSWRLQKECAGSGALGDIGSHATDLAMYLNGEIEAVSGMLTTFVKERPLPEGPGSSGKRAMGQVTVDDDAAFLGRFKNGSVGVFEASRFCTGRRNANTFEIYGSKGALKFDLERCNELQYYDQTEPAEKRGFRTISVLEDSHPYGGAWWPVGHVIGWEHAFVHVIHDFLTCIEQDRMPEPSFRDGIKVQTVLAAVERSAESQRWEKVSC
jgi:predicted dehydrogenase